VVHQPNERKDGLLFKVVGLACCVRASYSKKGPTKLGTATLLASSDAYCCVVVVCWTNSKLIGV